jgi:hypothetical protein
MRIHILALLVSLLTASTSAAQSRGAAAPNDQLPTTVILASDYPAFSPTQPAAVPLRALVLLEDPSGGDRKIILLNPAHANAHTLYEALSILRRRAGAPQGGGKFVPIGITPGVRRPSEAVALRLESILSTLKSSDAPRTALRYIRGATAEISDVKEFFRPDPQS